MSGYPLRPSSPRREPIVRRAGAALLAHPGGRRRALLRFIVGATTLLSAQIIFHAVVHATGAAGVGVAHAAGSAAQQPAGPPAVSAPALAAGGPAEPTTRRVDALNALGATIGLAPGPAVTSWHGVAGQNVHQRSLPNRSLPPVGELQAGEPVKVVRWVSGEAVEPRNDTWAELDDGTFVYSTMLRRAGAIGVPAPPPDAPRSGRWIDVNLSEQVATAYDGATALRTVLISSGRPGWETPRGVFPVLRRVERDTMDGATLLGQGPNGAGADYKVENVRYVQYFTDDGAAIHENYWRRPATFGIPGSHGCIGMTPADAAWFWEFATVGTPLLIHE